MTVKSYLLSVPRAGGPIGPGAWRRRGARSGRGRPSGWDPPQQLYQNLVDTTLRYLIEQVGGVEGVYGDEEALPADFLARRTAGNAVEVLGIVAFRASPVWILAALADLCGMGRHLIPEIADALKAQGLLEKDAQFATVDQMLDGLERTSSRLAATINTPPLDVADSETNGRQFGKKSEACRPPVFPHSTRSATCGRSSRQNPRGRTGRFSKHRR